MSSLHISGFRTEKDEFKYGNLYRKTDTSVPCTSLWVKHIFHKSL